MGCYQADRLNQVCWSAETSQTCGTVGPEERGLKKKKQLCFKPFSQWTFSFVTTQKSTGAVTTITMVQFHLVEFHTHDQGPETYTAEWSAAMVNVNK